MINGTIFQANKLTVMRSMVRAVSLPGGLGSYRSTGSINGYNENDDGEDLGGLVYSRDEDVPETHFLAQLRRYRALVRAGEV